MIRWMLIIVFATLIIYSPPVFAQTYMWTFEGDTLGQPPGAGGPNQPTSLRWYDCGLDDCSIEVQQSPLGIASQAVVISVLDPTPAPQPGLNWDPVVGQGSVHVLEFTASLDHTAFGASLLHMNDPSPYDVRLTHNSGTVIMAFLGGGPSVAMGTISAANPFRVRLEFDIGVGVHAILDPELDGFEDDPIIDNLSPIEGLIDLTLYVQAPGVQTSMAVDDVLIVLTTVFSDGFESSDISAWSGP